jgi:ribosome-associated protein
MSKNQYIDDKTDKIFQEYPYPQNMAMVTAWILGNLKGTNLKVLDVQGQSGLTDYFILASAQNPVQAQAMAEEISIQAKRLKQQIISIEGKEHADWILIDLADVIAHIFVESTRDIYDLDHLYADAPAIEIPQDYYVPSTPDDHEDKGYF